MPKEYLDCVSSEMSSGKNKDDAQRICAIRYYKAHGVSVVEAARREGNKMVGEINMQKNDLIKIYAPFEKVESGQSNECIVEGYMTSGSEDSAEEIVELAASFEAADEWIKIGNIREMHQPSAVGVALRMEKHAGKGVFLKAEVVDPIAKEKVRKGVYKGFSIGGKILRKEGNVIKKYKLLEVSLVDRPANYDSMFVISKIYDDTSANAGVSTGDKMANEESNHSVQESGAISKGVAAPSGSAASSEVELLKSELAKRDAEISELKKAQQLESIVSERVIKMVDELKPEIKKSFIEGNPSQPSKEEEMRVRLSKMSIGELTAMRFKADPSVTK